MEAISGSRSRCPSCLSFNDEDAKYCSQCGRPMDRSSKAGRSFFKVLVRTLLFLCLCAGGIAGGLFLHEKLTSRQDGTAPHDASRTIDERSRSSLPAETAETPRPGDEPAGKDPADESHLISPDAILEKAIMGLHLFTGRNRKGEAVSHCAAMRLPSGLAVPAAAIKGCASAWASGYGAGGFEIRMLLLYDEFTGGALIEAPGSGNPLQPADPVGLELGDRLYLVSPDRQGSSPMIVPGLFCGRTFDSSTGSLRYLAKAASAAPLGSVVLDGQARFLGLVPPGKGEGEEILFIPSGLFEIGSGGSLISLEDAYVLYYEGSFEALVREARDLAAKGRLREALDHYDQARLRDPRKGAEIDPELLTVTLNLAARLLEQRKPAEALEVCMQKSNDFPLSPELAVLAFRAGREAGDFPAAAGWMQRVGSLDEELYLSLEGEHTALYLEWSRGLFLKEDRRSALKVIFDGIALRPGSAALHESLGNCFKSLRDYRRAAAAYLDAIRLDPLRTDHLSPLVERCAELQATPGSVVLDFDPRKHIECSGRLGGRVETRFIVDTGASFTSIPSQAAERLGIRVKNVRDRSYIITANGKKEVPYVRIESLDVAGLKVKNILVLINDLPAPESHCGLLGLNFLKHFDYTIDHQSGRMVLKPK